MSLSYSAEKRLALSELSTEYLRDWAMDVPAAKLNTIVKELPTLGGFRPGKDAPIRLVTYFGRINRWSEEDWTLFGRLWTLWTQSHTALEQSLAVTSTEQLIELAQEMIELSDARRRVVANLIVASRGSSLTNDMLRLWYETGPFPSDPEISKLISMAQTASDAAIPGRLATIEQRESQFESAFQELSAELKSALGQLRSVTKLPGTVTGLESSMRANDERVKQVSGRLAEVEATLSRVIKSLDGRDQAMRKTRSEVTNWQSNFDAVSNDLMKTRAVIASFAADLAASTGSISALSADLQQVRGDLESLRPEVEVLSSRPLPGTQETILKLSGAAQPLVTDIPTTELIELETVTDASAHLAMNLNLLGIKLPQAQSLSLDVLAALTTGQLVTFSGSLGGIVAERCALSLAGADVKLVKIPVGLLDGQCLDDYLESWVGAAQASRFPVGVLIDGVNFSALEIFGARLRRVVIERLLGLSDRGLPLFLFASLIDGPSTVPHGRSLLELGPLFDTDAIGWLDSAAKPAIAGSLRLDSWSDLVPDARVDWEESWIPNWFAQRAGVVWRRAVAKAALFRFAIQRDSEISYHTIPPELAFGWVLPMALLIAPQEVNVLFQNVNLDVRGNNLLSLKGVDVNPE